MAPFDEDFEPDHALSQTAHALNELELYGYRPFSDELDSRPLPEGKLLAGAIADIFDALVAGLSDTRMEPDLEPLLWSTVNLFHRAADRADRQLDDNELAQQRTQREQDGSEVKSTELERLILEGRSMVERRDVFELMRDQAAEHFARVTGDAWRPRAGSMVNHKALTAAVIDSRDFVNAVRHAKTTVHVPAGARIAFSGGLDYNDYNRIWNVLDKTLAKHSEMVLLHGGSPRGAELIAVKWAAARDVPAVPFRPDWGRYKDAAPFKRNDLLLEMLPVGVIVFPGTGIQDNLRDKAKKLGIPVWACSGGA